MPRCRAAGGGPGPIPRKPCTTRFAEFYKPLQACNPPLRSENSHFFKCHAPRATARPARSQPGHRAMPNPGRSAGPRARPGAAAGAGTVTVGDSTRRPPTASLTVDRFRADSDSVPLRAESAILGLGPPSPARRLTGRLPGRVRLLRPSSQDLSLCGRGLSSFTQRLQVRHGR